MPHTHPALPAVRPLAIAHRGANSWRQAAAATVIGADMLEADIWPRLMRLEVRHDKTIGPLPIFWEKWRIERIGGSPLRLLDLLDATPVSSRLFLDLKGQNPNLGERVVRTIARFQPDRDIILCGRSWRQLDRVEPVSGVYVFYSVGTEKELAAVWPKLEAQSAPAISIYYRLLSDSVIERLHRLGATVIAWTVNDPSIAQSLFERGIDGVTSDNLDLVANIVTYRGNAFDHISAPQPPSSVG